MSYLLMLEVHASNEHMVELAVGTARLVLGTDGGELIATDRGRFAKPSKDGEGQLLRLVEFRGRSDGDAARAAGLEKALRRTLSAAQVEAKVSVYCSAPPPASLEA